MSLDLLAVRFQGESPRALDDVASRLDRRAFLAGLAAAAALSRRGFAHAPPGAREVPWLAEIQRPPATPALNAPALPSLLVDAEGKPLAGLEAWARRRVELRQAWEKYLVPLESKRPAPRFEVLESDTDAGVLRQLVRWESEPGLPVEAYLLRPLKIAGKVPGVVVLHSTVDHSIRQPAGLDGPPEKFFGLKLARQGCIAFCPRNFLWNGGRKLQENLADFRTRHPQSKGMAKMLWDAVRSVDLLVGLPEVDADRIGAVGHSLGAKETLYLAAFDERVRATVSSEGGIGVKFSNWDAPWYLDAPVKTGEFTREHHELLALIAPRPFLLVGGESADGDRGWPFIEAALPVYRLYGDPPRVGQFNHRKGHAVPPEAEQRIAEWLAVYLGLPAAGS